MHSETSTSAVATVSRVRKPAKSKLATESVKEGKKELPKATHSGILNLAGVPIECAVLDDGRRVISQKSFALAIGRKGHVRRASGQKTSSLQLPYFLQSAALKPFISKALTRTSKPIVFRRAAGGIGYGYEARLLPAVCRVFMKARSAGALKSTQLAMAATCENIVLALIDIGIVALIDEVTGYQDVRARDEMQKILRQYVSREMAQWVHTFHVDFYRQLYRLKGWAVDPTSSNRTSACARLTVDIVYNRIHPDLVIALKRARRASKKFHTKLHQWLTTSLGGGYPRLQRHLEGVISMMSMAQTWEQFQEALDRRYPHYTFSGFVD